MKFLLAVILVCSSALADSYRVIESFDCNEYFGTNSSLKMYLKVARGDDGGYDLAVSSRDKEKIPFGLVAFAPAHSQIEKNCSAQLIDFNLDPENGDLYAVNRDGSKNLIARAKNKLPDPRDLGTLFEIFREYEFVQNVVLDKVHHELRRGKRVTWSWDGREVYFYNYKNLDLSFSVNGEPKYYSSF